MKYNQQNNLIRMTKLAKACNDDISYKDLAESICVTDHAFYNWMNQYYLLSEDKANYLESLVIDLIDEDIQF